MIRLITTVIYGLQKPQARRRNILLAKMNTKTEREYKLINANRCKRNDEPFTSHNRVASFPPSGCFDILPQIPPLPTVYCYVAEYRAAFNYSLAKPVKR